MSVTGDVGVLPRELLSRPTQGYKRWGVYLNGEGLYSAYAGRNWLGDFKSWEAAYRCVWRKDKGGGDG